MDNKKEIKKTEEVEDQTITEVKDNEPTESLDENEVILDEDVEDQTITEVKDNEATELQDENETLSDEAFAKLQRIHEIDVQMHELEIKMEILDFSTPSEEEMPKVKVEYQALKATYMSLKLERKELAKKDEKTAWDKIPIWMIAFAMIQIVLCFPFISSFIWVNFANRIIAAFEPTLNEISSGAPHFFFVIMLVLIIFSLPIINIFISWIIYANFIKKDFNRKAFKLIWIGQGVLTLATMTWLYFDIIQHIV